MGLRYVLLLIFCEILLTYSTTSEARVKISKESLEFEFFFISLKLKTIEFYLNK